MQCVKGNCQRELEKGSFWLFTEGNNCGWNLLKLAPDCGRIQLKACVGCMRTRHFISLRSSVTYSGYRAKSAIEIFAWLKKERELQLQNIEKQHQSVWNPWMFNSLPVEIFSPTPPSHCFKGHWESDSAYLLNLTWPINHQPQAFSHRLRWGGLCAISWKRLSLQPCQTFFFY